MNPNDDTPPNSSAYLADFGSMGWNTSWLEFDEVRAAGYQNILNAMWDDMSNSMIANYVSPGCSSNLDRGPGTYLLRVMNEHDDTGEADVRYSWQGENHYTLRVSASSGDQPNLLRSATCSSEGPAMPHKPSSTLPAWRNAMPAGSS